VDFQTTPDEGAESGVPEGSLLTIDNLVALITLTALEVVLGIDNIVFISIIAGKLAPADQGKARKTGLVLAMVMRIALLLSLRWVMGLSRPLFTILGNEISGRDLILLIGGLFLIGKATFEIHEKVEGSHDASGRGAVVKSLGGAIAQIVALDIIFSLDSVITAVGLAQRIEIMIAAVVIAVILMLMFAGGIARFVDAHPTVKMLALSFLLLIGFMLILDGFGLHISKGYIYFAMAFSLFVELLNLRVRKLAARMRAD